MAFWWFQREWKFIKLAEYWNRILEAIPNGYLNPYQCVLQIYSCKISPGRSTSEKLRTVQILSVVFDSCLAAQRRTLGHSQYYSLTHPMLITVSFFFDFDPKFIGSLAVRLKVVSATFLLVCFLSLNDSTCRTRKNAFYFTWKALFVLEKIKF